MPETTISIKCKGVLGVMLTKNSTILIFHNLSTSYVFLINTVEGVMDIG